MKYYNTTSQFTRMTLVSVGLLLVAGLSYAADESVFLEAHYLSGPLAGQIPEGGLEPKSTVLLATSLSNDGNDFCPGTSGYKLFHTMAHAKGGDLKNIEYLAKGEGEDIDFEFDSGSAGQKNIYWPVFYCWSSSVPEVALSTSSGIVKQWTAPQRFDQDTVGGRCNLSNANWSSNSPKVGDEVTLSVDGTLGCKGRDFKFELWRGGRALFSRIETTIDAVFPTTGDGPFTVTKTWKVTSDNSYLFKARVPDPNGALAVSGEISPGKADTSEIKTTSLEFKNPLAAKDLRELINALLVWIFWLAIPTAVIMIVFAGITMMGSQGDPEKFSQGKKILLWAVVGLAVIFIGEGFIALIRSILNLGK